MMAATSHYGGSYACDVTGSYDRGNRGHGCLEGGYLAFSGFLAALLCVLECLYISVVDLESYVPELDPLKTDGEVDAYTEDENDSRPTPYEPVDRIVDANNRFHRFSLQKNWLR